MVLRRGIAWREERSGFYLYDPESDEMFAGNRVGLTVLHLLDRPRRIEDIVQAVAEAHGCAPEAVEEDITGFLESLARNGLLEAAP